MVRARIFLPLKFITFKVLRYYIQIPCISTAQLFVDKFTICRYSMRWQNIKSGKQEKREKWKAGTNENDSVQRDSNSSESGRAGKGDGNNGNNENNGDKTEKTDDTPAQRDSNSSECGVTGKDNGKNGSNENNGDKTACFKR